MRVIGAEPLAGLGRGIDCERPLRAVCRDCDHVEHWLCQATSEAKCAPCSGRTRRFLERITHHGIADRTGQAGLYLYFLTLTPPGENEHRRWYQGTRPRHRPECQCHHTWVATSRGEWNGQESAHWNRLRTSLDRLGSKIQYIGAVEVMDGKRRVDGRARGLLHRHVVIASDTPLGHPEVQALAVSAGYGCVLDLQPIASAERAAKYVSKYVVKSAGDRPDVAWSREIVNPDTGVLHTRTSPTFRTWSSSQRWGYTMSGVRAVAAAQARARARYLLELDVLLEHEASGPPDDPIGPGLPPDPPPVSPALVGAI